MNNYPYARPYVAKNRLHLIKLCAAKKMQSPFDWLQEAIDSKAKAEDPEVFVQLIEQKQQSAV